MSWWTHDTKRKPTHVQSTRDANTGEIVLVNLDNYTGVTFVATNESKTGVKHDQEKPDLSLLPIEFLSEVARAMMHGEKKYGRYNYTGGMQWSRIIAASMRHILAFMGGEDLDPESGVSHLGHAGACILMLTVYVKRNLGTDNREKK